MPRLHHGERRRRRCTLVALATAIALAGACSGASHPATAPTTTNVTTIATTTSAAPTATTPASTGTTLPSVPSSTSVSTQNGVVTVKGRGDRTVALPASVALPAIVHAEYGGKGSFVVSALDSRANQTAVLASSLGAYSGTFPVGFVDPANDPPASLLIATRGPWEIDIGSAVLAPALRGGQAGVGDTVIAYAGRTATAHLTFSGRGSLIVNMYEHGGLIPLVRTKGPYDGPISLVAGPAFIAVTTTGNWSIMIG